MYGLYNNSSHLDGLGKGIYSGIVWDGSSSFRQLVQPFHPEEAQTEKTPANTVVPNSTAYQDCI